MDGTHLAFVAALGVLAYIASYLLEKKYGPFPEESETGPFWWELPCGCPIEDDDDGQHRRYGDPLAPPPYNSFDEESKR